MAQNKINKLELTRIDKVYDPIAFYALIGEFALTFPKLTEYKKREAKNQLVRRIVSFCNEYKDIIIENYTIPFIGKEEFKQLYRDAKSELLNNAKELIRKYKLGEYQDIIIDNYSLTITALLNIAEYCFQNNKSILDICRLYSVLGYARARFDKRYGNEYYLISFINSWTNFATEKGVSKTKAQLALLICFDEIDSEDYNLAFDIKENNSIWNFFPFTIENIDKLIDFIQNFDDFDSDYFKRVNLIENNNIQNEFSSDNNSIDTNEILEYSSKELEPALKRIELKDDNDYPWHSLLCNYYVYIFNKANEEYPYSAFAVCAYSKWLTSNLSTISKYIPEISSSELQSLLFDYALDKYSDVTTIVDYEANLINKLDNKYEHEYDEIVNIMYKLHYKTKISNFELTDIWVYFIVNNALSYSNHKTFETASILQTNQESYVESGNIMLPWKYVRFVDGKCFFYHPNHERGRNAILPYIYEIEEAKKDFADLGKTILWNFPFISCRCENGKIIAIDEQFAKYVINEVAFIHTSYLRQKSNVGYTSITSKEILIRYKSKQFNFLELKQMKRFAIIPILENVSNLNTIKEEPALLFTVAVGKETCTLVYENASISKSTYIFIIDPELYDNAVKFISSYFTSKKINKRDELQYSRDMFNRKDGFLRVIRVIHDDNSNWESTINFYSKY